MVRKSLFGGPEGYAVRAFKTFQTVSEEFFSETGFPATVILGNPEAEGLSPLGKVVSRNRFDGLFFLLRKASVVGCFLEAIRSPLNGVNKRI